MFMDISQLISIYSLVMKRNLVISIQVQSHLFQEADSDVCVQCSFVSFIQHKDTKRGNKTVQTQTGNSKNARPTNQVISIEHLMPFIYINVCTWIYHSRESKRDWALDWKGCTTLTCISLEEDQPSSPLPTFHL